MQACGRHERRGTLGLQNVHRPLTCCWPYIYVSSPLGPQPQAATCLLEHPSGHLLDTNSMSGNMNSHSCLLNPFLPSLTS